MRKQHEENDATWAAIFVHGLTPPDARAA